MEQLSEKSHHMSVEDIRNNSGLVAELALGHRFDQIMLLLYYVRSKIKSKSRIWDLAKTMTKAQNFFWKTGIFL